ncbi:hypothetical protein I4U23_015413 [Adineta vaga]|nr:hypothetical protein I4U23_015413 [Adineta vaga]
MATVATATIANTTKNVLKKQQGWRSLIKPYIFSTVAIGASATSGDFICQYLERHKKKQENDINGRLSFLSFLPWWNRERSLIMCTSAVLVSSPWHFTVARTIERLFPGKQGIQIAKKILANTLIAPVGISLIFSSITLLKGQTFADAKTKVKNDMPKTYLAGTCYWPFVSFINFRFVPLDYRPFLGSLAGAIWNVYLSSVANQTSESSSNSAESTSTSINQTNSRIPSELKDL